MQTTYKRINMYGMGTTNAITTTSRKKYGKRNDQVSPYVPSQNWESDPREVGSYMSHIENMMWNIMRRFDTTHDNLNDLSCIAQKFDAPAVSIKHLEKQMTQLSTTVNPRQPHTLPCNTRKNPKNDGNCMSVTSHSGKKTMDLPMPSKVETRTNKYNDVDEVCGVYDNATEKEARYH